MFFMPIIHYIGDPPKVMMPGEDYLINTAVAEDLPVTNLNVFNLVRNFKFCNTECPLKIKFYADHVYEDTTFIGESLNIYALLDAMLTNSLDANATVFEIKVSSNEDRSRVFMTVSDDGDGIKNQDTKKKILTKPGVTTKSEGLGCSLFFGKCRLQKMRADIKYLGAGIDGKGASFEMSFLKRMPTN